MLANGLQRRLLTGARCICIRLKVLPFFTTEGQHVQLVRALQGSGMYICLRVGIVIVELPGNQADTIVLACSFDDNVFLRAEMARKVIQLVMWCVKDTCDGCIASLHAAFVIAV